MKVVLSLILVLGSFSANAWVDGNYECNGSVLSISTFKVGNETVPFIVRKDDGKVSFKGFAKVDGGPDYAYEYLNFEPYGGIQFVNKGAQVKDCKHLN